MSHLISRDEEVAQQGKQLYQSLRSEIENEENIGKIAAIDVHTGEYEIDNDLLTASLRLKDRHPNAEMWAERIGFNAVYTIGGTLTRTTL
jgi:hypothetical protein